MKFGRHATSTESASKGVLFLSGALNPTALAAAARRASLAAALSLASAASAAAAAAAAAAARTAATATERESNSSSEQDDETSSSPSPSSSADQQPKPVDHSIDNWFMVPYTMIVACDCQPVPIGPCATRPPHSYHGSWHDESGRLFLRLVGRNISSGRMWASSIVRALTLMEGIDRVLSMGCDMFRLNLDSYALIPLSVIERFVLLYHDCDFATDHRPYDATRHCHLDVQKFASDTVHRRVVVHQVRANPHYYLNQFVSEKRGGL
jgi:hypothetical protein